MMLNLTSLAQMNFAWLFNTHLTTSVTMVLAWFLVVKNRLNFIVQIIE